MSKPTKPWHQTHTLLPDPGSVVWIRRWQYGAVAVQATFGTDGTFGFAIPYVTPTSPPLSVSLYWTDVVAWRVV